MIKLSFDPTSLKAQPSSGVEVLDSDADAAIRRYFDIEGMTSARPGSNPYVVSPLASGKTDGYPQSKLKSLAPFGTGTRKAFFQRLATGLGFNASNTGAVDADLVYDRIRRGASRSGINDELALAAAARMQMAQDASPGNGQGLPFFDRKNQLRYV